MKEIYFQLNSLTVLMGISVAIIQYIFTNHQNTLKDILLNLGKINFQKNNSVDNELETKWEDAIRNCKTHTYILCPNHLIGIGFIFIALNTLLFIIVLFEFTFLGCTAVSILKLLSIGFFIFLCISSFVMYQIFSKESNTKKEFKNIKKQHSMVERVLASNKV